MQQKTPVKPNYRVNINLSDLHLFIKEAIMTNKEMRDVVKALNVELFKMNYKAGVRLPNLEAFLAGDDNALGSTAAQVLDSRIAQVILPAEEV